jgi:hypothetical protein
MMRAEFPAVSRREDLVDRAGVLARRCPVPRSPGVCAWYFADIPPIIDTSTCLRVDGLTLLYVGACPEEPPTDGRATSLSTLRRRLQTDYAGNAAASNLREMLGCLLADALRISLRRVGAGNRYTFTDAGEKVLDRWMAENAFVTWRKSDAPWELEEVILRSNQSIPLNVRDIPHLQERMALQMVMQEAIRRANSLPIVTDSGGARPALSD